MKAALALIVAVLLGVAAGCGARWTGDQRAEMTARYSTRERGSAASDGSGADLAAGGDPSSEGEAITGSTAPAGAAAGPNAAPAAATPGGKRPCTAPSTAPGVTPTEIAIGTTNSLSGPIPGLGKSHVAATRAYLAYRNSIGGVCGRQLRLIDGDDGGDNALNRSLVAEMSPKVLAIIPGVAGGGDGGAEIIRRDSIPAVGTSVTPQFESAPTYFNVRPLYSDYHVVTAKYRYLVEHGIRTAAVVYVNAASSPDQAKRDRLLMEAAGIKVVLDLPMPLTTLSYDSPARAVAQSKADYLFLVHDQGASASMARALVDAGYHLKMADYIVAYGSGFIDLAGSASEGATSWIDSLPSEDGGANAEQAAYLRWMERTAPDAQRDPFAALGWAGTKALLDTLEALPGPITREALVAQLRSTRSYDAGGFLAPIDLGGKHTKGCLVAMVVRGGRWQRLTPATGFLC